MDLVAIISVSRKIIVLYCKSFHDTLSIDSNFIITRTSRLQLRMFGNYKSQYLWLFSVYPILLQGACTSGDEGHWVGFS